MNGCGVGRRWRRRICLVRNMFHKNIFIESRFIDRSLWRRSKRLDRSGECRCSYFTAVNWGEWGWSCLKLKRSVDSLYWRWRRWWGGGLVWGWCYKRPWCHGWQEVTTLRWRWGRWQVIFFILSRKLGCIGLENWWRRRKWFIYCIFISAFPIILSFRRCLFHSATQFSQ